MFIVKAKKTIKKILPKPLINYYHFFLSFLGSLIYFFPSREIKVIGVTGTNGKSTVVNLASNVLEEAGYKVASISSINFKTGKEEHPNLLKMTMPGRLKLQKFLRKAVKKDCEYIVIEVTSEGIKQHRHNFIEFDVVVFTNLTPEHIESHGSFENYKKAKGDLFKSLEKSKKNNRTSIVNLDDENSEFFLSFNAEKRINYGIENSDELSLQAEELKLSEEGTRFKLKGKDFNLKIKGKFNVYNSLAAIAIGLSQGIDINVSKKAIEKIERVSGRMEEVIKEPFKVIVDYAHTPDALKNIYSSISSRKKICVLGSCGGGRDKWKRSQLGKIADEYCDQIFLTNEDPYDEDPVEIIDKIAEGIKEKNPIKIVDRKLAIKKALRSAQKGDAVIITGKGSEPWMCVKNGKKIHWDDREIVKEEIGKIKK